MQNHNSGTFPAYVTNYKAIRLTCKNGNVITTSKQCSQGLANNDCDKMNIWKPVHRKPKKLSNETVATESGAALPDVVAGLCYGDAGHGFTSSSEGAMIGYSSYYPDTQETRGRRREPRSHHTITPQGIGATPSGAYLPHPPHELGIVPAPPQGDTLRRTELSQAWPSQRVSSTSDYIWNQSFTVSPSGADPAGGSYGAAPGLSNYTLFPGEETLEGARVRSMSSEPHGHPSNRSNGDRRIRCSSATRNRQPRPRPNNHHHLTEQHQSQQHAASSSPLRCSVPPPNNLSPPSTSPPVQRIEYQQTSTVTVPTAGSVRATTGTLRGGGATVHEFREGGVDPLLETTGTSANRTDDIGVPGGGSYGYQVPDLEALLTHASPTRPANLPMVLASSTRLHNMRRSQETQAGATGQTNPQLPVRPILPLGIIVNAVFKTRDWLYVRTAHGAEGYVPYRVCLPLGILPPNRRSPPDISSDNMACGGAGPWELRGGGEYSGASVSNGATSRLVPSKSQPSAGFSSNTLEGVPPVQQQHRARHRGRRRLNAENTNQTDMQKLQPSTSRVPSESHGPPRETLDPPPSTNPSNIV